MRFRRALGFLYWEGAFSVAYEAICIGPTYLSGLAGEMHVPLILLTLVSSLPWIGAVGQLLGVFAFQRIRSPKRYTLIVAVMARAIWLIPITYGYFLTPFDAERWFRLVIIIAFFSALFSFSSVIAWSAWMKGFVHQSFHGRFFGVRFRFVMGAVVLTHFVGAILVKYKPDGNPVGYGALFAFAFLLAIASTLLLSRVPDVKKQQLPEARQRVGPIFEPLSSPAFRRLFVGAAVFNGSVQLAGPYFPYYFTRELGISMSEIAIWGALTGLGSVLTAGFWGRSIDRTREPADIMRFSAFMIALSPLAYLVTSGDIVRWYGPVEYFVNGFAWAGYQVAFSALLFRVCPPERSMVYFSLFTAFSGFCAGVGAFLGGKLAIWLGDYGGFRTLWCLTAALRLSVVFFLLSRLPRFTAASFWGNLSLWHVRRL